MYVFNLIQDCSIDNCAAVFQAHGDRYQKNDRQQNANADHHFLFHATIPSFQICHLPYTNIDAKKSQNVPAYNTFSAFSSPPSAHEGKLTCKRMEQKSPGGILPPGLQRVEKVFSPR